MTEIHESFTYIVECRDHTYYCGYTDDLRKRIDRHNAGTGARYTRSRGPVRLVYFERYLTKHDAMSREWHLKRLSHAEKEQLIQQNSILLKAAGMYTPDSADACVEMKTEPDHALPPGFFRAEADDRPETAPQILWFCRNEEWFLGTLGQHRFSPVCGLFHGEIFYLAPTEAVFFESPEMYLNNGMLLPGVSFQTEKK